MTDSKDCSGGYPRKFYLDSRVAEEEDNSKPLKRKGSKMLMKGYMDSSWAEEDNNSSHRTPLIQRQITSRQLTPETLKIAGEYRARLEAQGWPYG